MRVQQYTCRLCIKASLQSLSMELNDDDGQGLTEVINSYNQHIQTGLVCDKFKFQPQNK